MPTIHLLANSGIQYYTRDITLDPNEMLTDSQGIVLPPLSFCETCTDIIEDRYALEFVVYFPAIGKYVRYSDLKNSGYIDESDGSIVPADRINFNSLDLLDQTQCYHESMLTGLIPPNYLPEGKNCPLDCFENVWIPVPAFEDNSGQALFGPSVWCRIKLVPDPGRPVSKKGLRNYKLICAFDTKTIEGKESDKHPYFYDFETEKDYRLRKDYIRTTDREGNRFIYPAPASSFLFDFLAQQPHQCQWVDRYVLSLLHPDSQKAVIPDSNGNQTHFKYLSYYLFFVYYLGMREMLPDVRLYKGDDKHAIPVDFVLDIGNSRTCGLLFEQSDFTRVDMLHLRDYSEPWIVHKDPFDMRLVFRRADFGDMEVRDVFELPSVLRVGKEASKLIYRAKMEVGLSARLNNYSSPKRYLWDLEKYEGQWENLETVDDPFFLENPIYARGVSEQFNEDGTLSDIAKQGSIYSTYSRSSLMTFVMLEILQQAEAQINGLEFRNKYGNINIRRTIRRIIVTCPTAMSKVEQAALRRSAEEAQRVLFRYQHPELLKVPAGQIQTGVEVIPPVADILRKGADLMYKTHWDYDEATCCQLVYLYAELNQRYHNDCETFFNLYGHPRKELAEEGYEKNALTVASLDIGAGTTDVMICSYRYADGSECLLTPRPLFWDSYYYAGDDILQRVVKEIIIQCLNYKDGYNKSIYLELLERLEKSGTAEPRVTATNRLGAFLGRDMASMDFTTRRMRHEFNVQISIPIALKYMDLLRSGASDGELTFDDLFPSVKPSQDLLDFFAGHFGFRFEELAWRYDREQMSKIVVPAIEDLIEQVAKVFHAYRCDIVLLSGKPTSIPDITELFMKYYTVSPNRLICLNDYRVGNWYPFADPRGYFIDQKSIVATGAMIGYKASNGGLNGFTLNIDSLKRTLPTSNYIGFINKAKQTIEEPFITPDINNANVKVSSLPAYIGCKQLDTTFFKSRSLYILRARGERAYSDLRVSVYRDVRTAPEDLLINQITDSQGNVLPLSDFEFKIQTIGDEQAYWLDRGEFTII